MKLNMWVWGAALSGLLAACGQQASVPVSGVAAYAQRPELQDAQSQAILAQYSDDPGLLAALQTAYGERAPSAIQVSIPPIGGLSLESDRLAGASH